MRVCLSPTELRLVAQSRFRPPDGEARPWRIRLDVEDLPTIQLRRESTRDRVDHIALLHPKRVERLVLDLLRAHHFAQPQHRDLNPALARELATGVFAQVLRQYARRHR